MLNWLRRPKKAEVAARIGAIEICEPWARTMPDTPLMAGGFLTIVNGGDSDRLMGATCAEADTVELQGIKVVGAGIAVSAIEDGLYLHQGSDVTLKPRGYHLLILLKAPLAEGARLAVTLVFQKAGTLDVALQVKAPGVVGKEILNT